MKRIVPAVIILIIIIFAIINSILSFQARERSVSSIDGTPPIDLIEGIRVTTSSFNPDSYLSFRLTKEQIESLQKELNYVKFKKSNFLTRQQTKDDSFFSFDIDIMANKTAYKMTVYNNSKVVIDDEDTFFLTDTYLVRLLFEYTIEQIGYSKETE